MTRQIEQAAQEMYNSIVRYCVNYGMNTDFRDTITTEQIERWRAALETIDDAHTMEWRGEIQSFASLDAALRICGALKPIRPHSPETDQK